MSKEEQEKKIIEMTAIYKNIYKIGFKYVIFLLSIGLGIYLALHIMNTWTTIVNITDNDINQKLVTIKWFKKGLTEIKSSGNLVVYVGLGEMWLSWSSLFTYNNMVWYNWYILPLSLIHI